MQNTPSLKDLVGASVSKALRVAEANHIKHLTKCRMYLFAVIASVTVISVIFLFVAGSLFFEVQALSDQVSRLQSIVLGNR